MTDLPEFDAYLSLAEVSGDDHRWAFGTGDRKSVV